MMSIFSKKTIQIFINVLWVVGFCLVEWYNYPSFKDMYFGGIAYLVITVFIANLFISTKKEVQ